MIVCLPFFAGDKSQAVRLVNWIKDLGGVKNHSCLLVVDKGTNSVGVIEPLREAFRSVEETSAEPAGVQGEWGKGTTDATAANEMWLTAGAYVQHKIKKRWLWLEPDAVPLPLPFGRSWLDEIEAEDKKGAKPFTGAYVDSQPHEPHMSGVAVYPPCVADHSLDMAIPGKIAWDYAGRKDTIGKQKGYMTRLIQHEYRVDGISPTFPTLESLSIIRPEAIIFHRCKDSSLIDRLRERLGKTVTEPVSQPLAGPEEMIARRIYDRDVAILRARIEQLEGPKLDPSKMQPSGNDVRTEAIKKLLPAKPYTKKQLRSKRPLSADRKAQLSAALAKAREAKKQKAKA